MGLRPLNNFPRVAAQLSLGDDGVNQSSRKPDDRLWNTMRAVKRMVAAHTLPAAIEVQLHGYSDRLAERCPFYPEK